MNVSLVRERSKLDGRLPGAALVEAEQRLSGELAVLAGHLNVVHARVVEVAAEALRSGAWSGWGVATPDRWLAWKTGVSAAHARALVGIAKRVDELPVTFAAFAAGELTVDQAALIFRRVPAHNDAEIAALARNATVEQLRRVVYKYPFTHPKRRTAADAASDDAADAGPTDPTDDAASAATDASSAHPAEDGTVVPDPGADVDDGGGARSDTGGWGCGCHGSGEVDRYPAGDSAPALRTFPGWGDNYAFVEPIPRTARCGCAGHRGHAAGDGASGSSRLAPFPTPTMENGANQGDPAAGTGGSIGGASRGGAGAEAGDTTTGGASRGGPGAGPHDERMRDAVAAAMAAGRVAHGFDADGRFYLHADLPADEGAVVAQALAEAKDRLFRANGTASWVDALVDVAERSLGAVESPDRRDRYRTYVMLDTEGAWIVGGPAIPQPLFEKLTCDGELRPVWTEQGIPVNVGRSQRTPSEHVRRLVLHRDKTCRFPGCTRTRGLQVHHGVHWGQQGPTDTANLLSLCVGSEGHHDMVHRGEITVTGNADTPDGLTFRNRHGTPITARQQPVPPNGTPPPGPPPGHRYQAPFGDPLHLEHLAFNDPPDTTVA